jgi:hypothetical protein
MMASQVYWTPPPVNTYTSYKTILPPEVKLKPKEIQELAKLEESFNSYFQTSHHINDVNLTNTTNLGVHYFCVENGIGLKKLAGNKKISPDMAFLILCKLDDIATIFTSFDPYYELLNNPVVYKNLDLFKIVFEELYELDDDSVLTLLFRTANYIPVESFMVAMAKVSSSKNDLIKRDYLDLATVRSADILAYAKEKNPDLGELPLSWVLKAYGF